MLLRVGNEKKLSNILQTFFNKNFVVLQHRAEKLNYDNDLYYFVVVTMDSTK